MLAYHVTCEIKMPGLLRLDIASQEQKVCDMEVGTVKFVVKSVMSNNGSKQT